MGNLQKGNKKRKKNYSTSIKSMVLVLLIAIIGVVGFLKIYNSYIDETLYAERLSQMREVTTQLFSGLEDVVENQWKRAKDGCRKLLDANPQTLEEFIKFMERQAYLEDFKSIQVESVAVDKNGRYYTQSGGQGLWGERNYLSTSPKQVSFVSNSLTYDESRMFFLKKLSKPLVLKNDKKTVEIIYYGVSQNMEELNPYFNCTAYDGNNSVYVVDTEGLRLFNSKNNEDLLQGFNAYTTLSKMKYLHGTSFADTKKELDKHNIAYSNALLKGNEIYYALYHMESAEWVLIFLVPSKYVATNTVKLVDITVRIVLLFASLLVVFSVISIFVFMRQQQKEALAIEKQNNEVLEQVNTELKHAVQTAEKATKIAEAASKAKSNFLANMSHDIRTPMNAIVGITGLMKHEREVSDKMRGYIDKVQLSSQHLLGLINDILDMSRIESSEVTLNIEKVNLAEQIGQIDSIIRAQANEHNQKFCIHADTIVHEYLIGDSVRLRQILLNLLSNAVKYTPNGGKILLDLKEVFCDIPNHAKFVWTVTDNGYGMTKEFMERIFDPFTRAEDSVTNKVQGTGLGMAITKNIVDLMNGEIYVDSKVGKGSRFKVVLTLPIDTKMHYEIDKKPILLIANEERLIKNIEVSMLASKVEFYVVSTLEEAKVWLTKHFAEVILLSNCTANVGLKEEIHLLREVTNNDALIFAIDYVEDEQERSKFIESGFDGAIDRPFFLSNLSTEIIRMESNIASENNTKSIIKGKRFLCAEDNELNAEILNEILDMYEAQCTIYSNGVEIVQAFKNVKPGEYDAILMDIQMPTMNGLQATKEIRNGKNPLGKTIPIVAMTANAFSEDVQQCIEAGMDAHIAKPLDIAALEKTLRRLINK